LTTARALSQTPLEERTALAASRRKLQKRNRGRKKDKEGKRKDGRRGINGESDSKAQRRLTFVDS